MSHLARLGDLTHCERHGTEGVIAEGLATVIIGGRAAATVGSRVDCPRCRTAVSSGAPGLILGGRHAACTGDATPVGAIVSGAGTVIVGRRVAPAPAPPARVTEATLESLYAHERLVALAAKLGRDDFCAWLATVFGRDLPLAALRAFHGALNRGAVAPPRIVLVRAAGDVGAYDNIDRVILIPLSLARAAARDELAREQLFVVLLHEHGHHWDRVLRADFADGPVAADAPFEEGAALAVALPHLDVDERGTTAFATFREAGVGVPLSIEYGELRAELGAVPPPQRTFIARRFARFEGFTPVAEHEGPRSWSHERIESTLLGAGLTKAEVPAAYFGNFLRDYSQIVTPFLLRPKAGPRRHFGFSRRGLTAVVDVLAQRHFADAIARAAPGSYEVTEARLGVPVEHQHCDNPQFTRSYRHVDPDFRADVAAWELAIDPTRWTLGAIWSGPRRSGDPTIITAAEYVDGVLRRAVGAGRTVDGLRLLGEALHAVEDLYSHSNFVELALEARGYGVPLWARRMTDEEGPTALSPLVSGRFGLADTAASLLHTLAAAVEKNAASDEKHARGLAIELLAAWLTGLELRAVRDALDVAWVERFAGARRAVLRAANRVIPAQVRALDRLFQDAVAAGLARIADEIASAQASAGGDAWPTHTMLAKDHDDHPLHEVAARCASVAADAVTRAVTRAWSGLEGADEVARVAGSVFVHPAHRLAAAGVPRRAVRLIAGWAHTPAGVAAIAALEHGAWSEERRRKYRLWSDAGRRVFGDTADGEAYRELLVPYA